MNPPSKTRSTRGARSVQRILDAAADMFGQVGFQSASMTAVAKAAGVSKGLLHYHFQSKEHLLIEAQRATFHQIHQRFEARFESGERGLSTALEGLDVLWQSLCDMRSWAPFFVETMNLARQGGATRRHVDEFYEESTALLRRGIDNVFVDELEQLALPPQRLAMLIRTTIHGLVIELAYARDSYALARVQQTYVDFRSLFARTVLSGPLPPEVSP